MLRGKIEGTIVAQAIAAGDPIPEAILNAPQLRDGLEFFYRAFWELVTCSVDGVIPWTAFRLWADHNKLDEETFELLYLHVRAMEDVKRKFESKKAISDGAKVSGNKQAVSGGHKTPSRQLAPKRG